MKAGTKLALVVTLGALVIMGGVGVADAAAPQKAAPTKAEFIAQGDAICTAGSTATDKQIAKEFPDLTKSTKAPSKADQKKIAAIIISGVNSDIKKLKKLGTPAGDEKQVNAIYAAVKKDTAALKKDPGSLFGDAGPLNTSSALAAAYGFQKCGQGD